MSKEFEDFCRKNKIPMWIFRHLPPGMRNDIEKRYFELKESEEKKNVKC